MRSLVFQGIWLIVSGENR